MEARRPGRILDARAEFKSLRRSLKRQREFTLSPRLLGDVVKRFRRRRVKPAAAARPGGRKRQQRG
jgi:hypothetical protein